METIVGLTLVTAGGMSLIGIMPPLVLFFADLVSGASTLETQYLFEDIVLLSGGMVIAAKALDARLVPPPESLRP